MKRFNNLLVLSALVAGIGFQTSVLAEEKKLVSKYEIKFGVVDGKDTTVTSKYDFTYEPIVKGFKLPAEGSKIKGQNNPMNLTLDKNGEIVTDHNTKLQWTSRTLLVWTNLLKATEHCSNIRTGGYDDWRIPTIKELTTIADYNTFEPTFSRKLFPGVPTIPSGYWAIPKGAEHPMGAWHIGFDGHIMGQPADANKMTRCVRADGQKAYDKNLFVDNKNGTISDKLTSLTWQQSTKNVAKVNYRDANKYCKKLDLGGRTNWRLPHLKELISVSDFSTFRPAMDEKFFKDILPEFYWSSTLDSAYGTDTISGKMTFDPSIPNAWAVETMSGGAWRYPSTNKFAVRCVSDDK